MSGTAILVDPGTTAQATAVAVDGISGTNYQIVKLDMGALGSSSPFTGTIQQINNIGTIPNLAGGTLNSVIITGGTVSVNELSGTINLGTAVLNNGTIDVVKNAGTIQGGTLNNLASGTINSATVTGNVGISSGTINVSTISTLPNLPGGTLTNLISGTINAATAIINSATISVLPNTPGGTLGLVTRVGNVGTLEVGTITTLPNIPGGTITRVLTLGTLEVGTISTLPNIPGGTIGVVSNITNGSIRITTGTITTGNGGTDPTIFIPARLTDGTNFYSATGGGGGGTTVTVDHGSIIVTASTITTGTLQNLVSGTINSATVVINSATISVLPNLPQGSINVTAGTIATLGTMGTLGLVNTVTTVTTVSNLSNGTVRVTEGTIATGTIGGKAASGAAASGNPVFIGGTAASGSVYGLLTDVNGVVQINGTVSTGGSGTQATRIIDGTVTNVGTLVGAGTLTNVGSVTNIGQLYNAGTVQNQLGGTLDMLKAATITTLPNLPGGSIAITAGTIATLGTMGTLGLVNTVTTVSNLSAGSLAVIAGTITNLLKAEDTGHSSGDFGVMNLAVRNDNGTSLVNTDLDYIPLTTDANGALRISGTVATGAGTQPVNLINGTLTLGTIVGKDVNAAAQTGNPLAIGGTDSGGTIRTVLVDSSGAMKTTTTVNASVGTISVGTVNTGTVNVATVTAGTINVGTVLGNVASGASDSGNPVKVGAVFQGTAGTVTDGQRVNLQADAVGNLKVYLATKLDASNDAVAIGGGTLNAGTVRLDARTTQNIVSYGTNIANSGASAATIVGSASVGAGTSLWLQDVSVLNPNSGAATVILGFGTAQQGTNVLFRGILGTNGAVGIEKSYAKAVNAGMTNQDLVFSTTGAGTMDLSISYLISAQ